MAKSLVAQLFHVQADMVLRFFLVGGGVLLFWRGVWGVFDFYDIKNVSSIVGVPCLWFIFFLLVVLGGFFMCIRFHLFDLCEGWDDPLPHRRPLPHLRPLHVCWPLQCFYSPQTSCWVPEDGGCALLAGSISEGWIVVVGGSNRDLELEGVVVCPRPLSLLWRPRKERSDLFVDRASHAVSYRGCDLLYRCSSRGCVGWGGLPSHVHLLWHSWLPPTGRTQTKIQLRLPPPSSSYIRIRGTDHRWCLLGIWDPSKEIMFVCLSLLLFLQSL